MLLGGERHGKVESTEIAPGSSLLVKALRLPFYQTQAGKKKGENMGHILHMSGREGYTFCVALVSLCVCPGFLCVILDVTGHLLPILLYNLATISIDWCFPPKIHFCTKPLDYYYNYLLSSCAKTGTLPSTPSLPTQSLKACLSTFPTVCSVLLLQTVFLVRWNVFWKPWADGTHKRAAAW